MTGQSHSRYVCERESVCVHVEVCACVHVGVCMYVEGCVYVCRRVCVGGGGMGMVTILKGVVSDGVRVRG